VCGEVPEAGGHDGRPHPQPGDQPGATGPHVRPGTRAKVIKPPADNMADSFVDMGGPF